MNQPLVSVVMPSYNHGHLIVRALDSVLAQSYANWELLVVDNHSTDDTAAVLQRYAADPRIRVLPIHNQGIIAASRNLGVQQARGEWVAFLDSDDWWTPDKLQACVAALQPRVDVLYHDLALAGDGQVGWHRRKIRCWQTRIPVLNDLLVRGNALATSAVMARRELLLQVANRVTGPAYAAAADYACWLNLASLTDGFSYLPRVLGTYLVHGQGVSRRDMTGSTEAACQPFLSVLGPDALRAHQSWLRYGRGRHLFTSGQRGQALADLRFCARWGSGEIRLKSLWMLAQHFLGSRP